MDLEKRIEIKILKDTFEPEYPYQLEVMYYGIKQKPENALCLKKLYDIDKSRYSGWGMGKNFKDMSELIEELIKEIQATLITDIELSVSKQGKQ